MRIIGAITIAAGAPMVIGCILYAVNHIDQTQARNGVECLPWSLMGPFLCFVGFTFWNNADGDI